MDANTVISNESELGAAFFGIESGALRSGAVQITVDADLMRSVLSHHRKWLEHEEELAFVPPGWVRVWEHSEHDCRETLFLASDVKRVVNLLRQHELVIYFKDGDTCSLYAPPHRPSDIVARVCAAMKQLAKDGCADDEREEARTDANA